MDKILGLCTSLLILICVSTTSCQNDLEEITPEVTVKIDGHDSFLYHGKLYKSDFYFEEDSSKKFLDEEVQSISINLSKVQNLISFIHSDGIIEYFNDENELGKIVNSDKKCNETRSLFQTPSARIYTDSKRKGESAFIEPYEDYGILHVALAYTDNQWYNFDNKISSFELWGKNGTKIVFFSESYFKGYALCIEQTSPDNYGYMDSLKGYSLYPGSKHNWNDSARSLRLF